MNASHDTYTRRQGLKQTYDVEYTSLRYQILLNGKLLKAVQLPLNRVAVSGDEAAWRIATADIEFLRGMPEA